MNLKTNQELYQEVKKFEIYPEFESCPGESSLVMFLTEVRQEIFPNIAKDLRDIVITDLIYSFPKTDILKAACILDSISPLRDWERHVIIRLIEAGV